MESFVQVTSCDLRVDKLFERWNYDIMISLNLFFRTLLWFFSLSRHGRKHWLPRLHCGGDKSLLIIYYANFLTVFWQFSDVSKYFSSFQKEIFSFCPNLLFVRRLPPLTSYDLYSQILSVYERSIKVFLNFFWVVFTSESGNLLTYMKNIHFSFSLGRPMETSRRNTASRHRDNIHVYDKWPV